jgi:hypothetical protein
MPLAQSELWVHGLPVAVFPDASWHVASRQVSGASHASSAQHGSVSRPQLPGVSAVVSAGASDG